MLTEQERKICRICKKNKGDHILSNVNGNLRMCCNKCNTAKMNLYYKKCPENVKKNVLRYQQENKEKVAAWEAVSSALIKGSIKKPKKCTICNKKSTRIHGHHHDYSKPFDVMWLCPKCHKDEHKKL